MVVDINYDEHTPAWGEQTARTGIPLGGGGRTSDAEGGANIDVDWDPDEPPTRLWMSESMRLPLPSRPQPRAAETPTPAEARITGVRTRTDLPAFKPLPPLPEFTPLPDLGPLPTFNRANASLPEFTPLPPIARLPPIAPTPEYEPPPRAARRASPEILPPARATKPRRRQTLPPAGPVHTQVQPAAPAPERPRARTPEPRAVPQRPMPSLERTQIMHAPPAPPPPQPEPVRSRSAREVEPDYGNYDAFEGDAAEQQAALPSYPRTQLQPSAALPAFDRTLLSHGAQPHAAPVPGGLVERTLLAHGQRRPTAPPIPAAARVERGPELLPELAHNRNYFPGLTDDPPELSRAGDRRWLKPALGAGAVAVLGGLGMWIFSGPASIDLVVETTPADAKVTLDGKALHGSQSPYTLEKVLVGPHMLAVQKPGFTDHNETLNIDDHEKKHTHAVKLDAVPAKNKADLAVSSLPPGAAIIVDGQPSGLSTPAAVSLNYGYHTVQLRLDGYAEGEQAIKVPDESSLSLNLNASQPTAAAARASRASAHESSHAPAALSGDDAAAKRSEVRAAKIRTRYRANKGKPPRPEDAEIIREADGPDSSWLTMYESGSGGGSSSSSSSHSNSSSSSHSARAKEDDSFTSSKPAAASGGRTGTLQVNSRPWAEVYLDGQHLGHTPLRGAEVPAGKHTLKLTNPGMDMSKSLSITVVAGQTLTKIETLSE